MKRVLLYAVLYFAIVFVIGFALGTLRTLVLVPKLGEIPAVLLELPVMIALSWWAAGWSMKRLPLPPQTTPRALAGGIAFILLLLGEAAISIWLAGLSIDQHVALYETLPVQLGLLGQVLFAVFPLFSR